MTPDVLFVIWWIAFLIAAIPGVVVGWIVGASFGLPVGSVISLAIAVFASLVLSGMWFPGVNPLQFESLIMFVPPFSMAGLLGVGISGLTSRSAKTTQPIR